MSSTTDHLFYMALGHRHGSWCKKPLSPLMTRAYIHFINQFIDHFKFSMLKLSYHGSHKMRGQTRRGVMTSPTRVGHNNDTLTYCPWCKPKWSQDNQLPITHFTWPRGMHSTLCLRITCVHDPF